MSSDPVESVTDLKTCSTAMMGVDAGALVGWVGSGMKGSLL
jgi:hypothetical protein